MRPKGWCVPVPRGTGLSGLCIGIRCVEGEVFPTGALSCLPKQDQHGVSPSQNWKGPRFGQKGQKLGSIWLTPTRGVLSATADHAEAAGTEDPKLCFSPPHWLCLQAGSPWHGHCCESHFQLPERPWLWPFHLTGSAVLREP
jgi:hypothetical protein